MQIKNAGTIDELNAGLQQPSIEKILDAQGALPSASSVSEKHRICDLLVRHILIDSVQFLINDMREGLETLGVLQAIQRNPEKFRELFIKEYLPKLDAEIVDLLFVPKLAEEGSNKRASQEQAIVYWRDYLQDCMGKLPNPAIAYNYLPQVYACTVQGVPKGHHLEITLVLCYTFGNLI